MEQDKTETFVFQGKEYKVTPEVRKCCEQLAQDIADTERFIAEYGNVELPPEVCRRLDQITEQIVAEAGLNCATAQFLKVRA